MKQVLFEEDGAFRVGTILAEAGASFQVEAAHGKRSKVKAASILLRFDNQALQALMPEAQKLSEDIDPQFLWEVGGASPRPDSRPCPTPVKRPGGAGSTRARSTRRQGPLPGHQAEA